MRPILGGRLVPPTNGTVIERTVKAAPKYHWWTAPGARANDVGGAGSTNSPSWAGPGRRPAPATDCPTGVTK